MNQRPDRRIVRFLPPRSLAVASLAAGALLAGGIAAARPAPPAAPDAGRVVHARAQAAERYELSGSSVRISDLAGHVSLVSGSGDHVVVLVHRGGPDADQLRVQADQGAGTLRIDVPGDRVVYPELGHDSRTTVHVGTGGLFGHGRRVTVAGSGSGPEAWADLTIQVPRGRRAEVELGAGRMEAKDVPGDLDLHTGSGDVSADATTGSLAVHTGSGDVEATSTKGHLEIHSGSGDVTVDDAAGAAELATGSGDIDIRGRVGGSLEARTGSGDVTAEAVDGDRLFARTGSGDIRLGPVQATDVELHTGSGSVRARMARAPKTLRVDTGSGEVDLALPRDVSADLDIETGSGGIRVDMPVQLLSSGRSHFRGKLGGGGPDFVIRTGSGGVHLTTAGS